MEGSGMPIDLQAKKTEAEWIQFSDKMIRDGTRTWFDWCEWVLITGALMYLTQKSKNWFVALAALMSLVTLFIYFTSYIAGQLLPYNFPLIKSEKVARVLSVIISLSISFGIYYLLKAVIFEVAAHKE
jgi:hypothetical protein